MIRVLLYQTLNQREKERRRRAAFIKFQELEPSNEYSLIFLSPQRMKFSLMMAGPFFLIVSQLGFASRSRLYRQNYGVSLQ